MPSEPEELINADRGKSKTWPERNAHTIDFIKNADRDMKLLSCADKLANLQDIIRNYDRLECGCAGCCGGGLNIVVVPVECRHGSPLIKSEIIQETVFALKK